MEALEKNIEQYPDAYQYERAERLGCGLGGIYHALKCLGVSYKKTLKHPKSEPVKRSTYGQQVNQASER